MKTSLVVAATTFFAAITAAAAQPSEIDAIDRTIACMDIDDDADRLACLDEAAQTLKVTRIIREDAVAEKKADEREQFGLNERDLKKEERRLAKEQRKQEKREAKAARKAAKEQRAEAVIETEDDFGGEAIPERRREREEQRLKSITAKVAEIRVNRFGTVTLSLANGQVWRQLDSDSKRLRLNENRLYTAKVKRSLMGNYLLTVNELKRTIRVRRIK